MYGSASYQWNIYSKIAPENLICVMLPVIMELLIKIHKGWVFVQFPPWNNNVSTAEVAASGRK